MTEFAIVIVICATIVYVANMFKPRVPSEVHRDGVPMKREAPPVPSDLLLQASKWHDAWAREQALRNIQELYETTEDWDRVRYIYSQQSIADGDS